MSEKISNEKLDELIGKVIEAFGDLRGAFIKEGLTLEQTVYTWKTLADMWQTEEEERRANHAE